MKTAIINYVKTWENRCYSNGIPDEVPKRIEQLNKAPSYRMICLALLKNDYSLKTLGFTPKKCESYNQLKKIELSQRKNTVKQLTLF